MTAKPGPLDVAGVVGTGLMGGGITMCWTEADTQVFLLDIDEKALARDMGVIGKNFARSVERKSKSQNGGGLATSHFGVLAQVCRSASLGTLLRFPAMMRRVGCAGLPTVGTLRRYHPSGSECAYSGHCAVMSALRGLLLVGRFADEEWCHLGWCRC